MNANRLRMMMLLSFLVMVIAIAGCSKSDSDSVTPSSTAPPATTDTTGNKDGNSGSEGTVSASIFPLKEPASFEIFSSAHDTNPQSGNEPIFAELEKRTNVKLNLINIPAASYQDKFEVTMATGSLPDTMGMGVDLAKKYGMDGALLALDDLLEQYGANIMASIEEMGVESSLRAIDGKIYGIPYYTTPGVHPDSPIYRQDWLDQLGLKAPTTPEEWREVLRAFKDAKLGGKDTIPYAPLGYDNFPILKAFEADRRMYITNDGEGDFRFGLATPGAKDAFTFLHELFEEGLIDPEFAMISKQQWEAKVSMGNVGAIFI